MQFFSSIEEKFINYNNVHEISFKLLNIHSGLANSLRRIMLTDIPNISFGDENINEPNSSITIHKNTSALHNEFLAHRISLVPICVIHNNVLRIKTYWDNMTQERKYAFSNPEKIPIFTLKKENSNLGDQHQVFNNSQIQNIYSSDFTYLTPDDYSDYPIEQFFPKDIISNDYILINKLKPSFNDNNGEEINITCKVTIGTGKQNTRYCPVGTVTYSFEQDSSEAVDRNFEQYVEYLQKERMQKKIHEYKEEEILDIKKSYKCLDAYRVYKKDSKGHANSILFNIETIGGMNPYVILYDSLHILELKLQDILRSIYYKYDNTKYVLHTTNKLKIKKVDRNLYDIYINKEDHTIGNLLSFYMKYLYMDGSGSISDLLKIVSYKMPHPLEDKIIIRMNLLDTLDIDHCLKCTHLTNSVRDKRGEKITTTDISSIQHKDKWLCMELFQLTMLYIINIIETLKLEWSSNTPAKNTSFDIIHSTFIKKTIPIHIIHEHLQHAHDLDYTPPPILNAPGEIDSPDYQPTSPTYQATSPPYQPASPPYQATSPPYQAASPPYQPASPDYQPVTPTE